MQYKVYKMAFTSGVHFGENSLEDSNISFCCDTLFSALCQEAIKIGEEKLTELYDMAKNNKFRLSDAFPYAKDNYYLPKPMLRLNNTNESEDSTVKKAFKKLKYISCTEIDDFLKGNFDVKKERDIDNLGDFNMRVSASIRGEKETVPYRVGTYFFKEGNGLYVIVACVDDEVVSFLEELLINLSFAGIGGRRNAGLGRFDLEFGKMSPKIFEKINNQSAHIMTLSQCLPKDDELERAMNNACYLVKKRSGFVSSETYADEQMRKKDLYVFSAGSCFEVSFFGDVYDVSNGGKHPVYRYAKPLFMGV